MRHLIARAVTIALCLAAGAAGSATAQNMATYTTSRIHAGEERLAVEIEFAAGELHVTPAPAGTLYRTVVEFDARRASPVAQYTTGKLRLGLAGESSGPGRNQGRAQSRTRMDVALSPDAILDLSLEFGAARADIDLGGLRIERLDIGTGASETSIRFSRPNPVRASSVRVSVGAAALRVAEIGNMNAERLRVDGGVGDVHLDFSGDWQNDLTAEVRMGVGALTLVLPRTVGVQIVRESFLTSFDTQGLEQRDGGYFTSNWEQADRRLTIHVEAAFGLINVRWTGDAR
ncbi:MAG TPA: hypothetical protein VNZ57_01900 [Longimicrobiales bacterium]|nr:hypothetical protein [Longimicrobiales bacterium]